MDRDSWEKVSNHHVLSANNFIEQIILKRKKHIQWIKPNSKKLFDAPPNELKKSKNLISNEDHDLNEINTRYNINSWKDKNDILCMNDINIDFEEKKKEKIINKKIVKNIRESSSSLDLNIERYEKNPKYNYSNSEIIKNIEHLHKEINKIEFNFIDDKDLILRNLKNNIV